MALNGPLALQTILARAATTQAALEETRAQDEEAFLLPLLAGRSPLPSQAEGEELDLLLHF